ncbi:MAG: hypothetical protein MUC40_00635 [Akkermansiaceae bacterium]|nr:hypothetical protein [Akkermansiaceae bacterium]
MRVDPITPDNLATALALFELRPDGTPPREILPPAGAVVIDDYDAPMAAAWLYQPAGCKLAILDWLITRPGLHGLASKCAVLAILAHLEHVAKDGGASTLFASMERAKFVNQAMHRHFNIAACGCTHLVKQL